MSKIEEILKAKMVSNAASMGTTMHGKTFQEWLGWANASTPDAKSIRPDLQEFCEVISALEESMIDQVGAIEIPGMGQVRAISFPSNDQQQLAQCLITYSKVRYLLPEKLEKKALSLYPGICKAWDEIDVWLGQLVMKDSLIEKHAFAWYEGHAPGNEIAKPSLVEVIKHWAPVWNENPYKGPQPDEVMLYQSQLNSLRLVSLGMKEGQWLPSWNTMIPFLWKSRFLLPEMLSNGIKARECMAACMLVSKMYDKMETYSHIGEPTFLDHDALAAWNVTVEG